MTILVTGGSGSGKSVWAEKAIHALNPGQKIYLATMQAYDPESEKRIRRHRLQREGLNFITIECPLNLSSAHIDCDTSVLLEDIPNLLANEMFGGGNDARILPDLKTLSRTCEHLIIVTNDVFSDSICYPDKTALYMKRLGMINSELASLSDTVTEVVYSIPVFIKGRFPHHPLP